MAEAPRVQGLADGLVRLRLHRLCATKRPPAVPSIFRPSGRRYAMGRPHRPVGHCSARLETVRLPAAPLLGPMIAAIVVPMAGGAIRVPHAPVLVAQAVIGCMIARSIPPAIIGEIARGWPLFVSIVVAVIAASGALGWLLTRWRVLPGTTAVWRSSPGAATAMMLMAAAHGALAHHGPPHWASRRNCTQRAALGGDVHTVFGNLMRSYAVIVRCDSGRLSLYKTFVPHHRLLIGRFFRLLMRCVANSVK
jgi:membrane AbrB-like protein